MVAAVTALLIAHPDDEAMFFSPTLMSLRDAGIPVRVLCFTSGDAAGLGRIRQRELIASLAVYGIRGEDKVFILDDKRFPDSMTESWCLDDLADLMVSFTRPGHFLDASFVNRWITFDDHGVSSHPNHIAVARGAAMARGRMTTPSPPSLLHLRTTGVLAKYTGIASAAASLMLHAVSTPDHPKVRGTVTVGTNTPPPVYGGLASAKAAWTAMRCHASQFVWFRVLWLIFSRYVFLNDYIATIPLD